MIDKSTKDDIAAWEKLGDELRALDEWGDFDVAQQHPQAKKWPQIRDHPVNLMMNGCVPPDHFETYVPTLLRSLDELTIVGWLEGVVRALTKKGLTGITERLLQLYRDERYTKEHSFLYAVGNAIYTVAPKNHLDECIEICRDANLSYSRNRLIEHLSRFKNSEEVFQTLLELLEDESARGAALEALKRYGDVRAIPSIERTPVRDGDEGVYETHQKQMALKKLHQKQQKQQAK